ncbi:MAG: gamma-glutamyltransferase, partial [Bacteroidota bacterium]
MTISSLLRVLMLSVFVLLLTACGEDDYDIKEGRGIICSNGMVVSAHPAASRIGNRVLIDGGNAWDAAAATGFALSVCYPTAGNLGGGALMVMRSSDGEYTSLDSREKAPAGATSDMYLDAEGNVIEGMSTGTRAASGVPGSVAGLLEMHGRYGVIPLEDIIQPSIDMAKNGFMLTAAQAASLNRMREKFTGRNDHATAFVKDSLWTEGDTLVQPDLALTLERIRDYGQSGFYSGETAGMIIREMVKGNGLIKSDDLEKYKAVWREPLTGNYSDYRIISMPPPSSGGIALIQLLGMTEDSLAGDPVFHSPEDVHLISEAERRVYADRAYYLGDPDYVSIPLQELADEKYLDKRMSDFDPLKASSSDDIGHGLIPVAESEETTHFSVVDKDRNAVAVTTTLNSGYGNCIVVE